MSSTQPSRKSFFKTLFSAVCGALLGPTLAACARSGGSSGSTIPEHTASKEPAASAEPTATPTPGHPVTPDDRKVAFAKVWAARMMNCLDETVDADTREKLMKRCGQTCFINAHGAAQPRLNPPTLADLDNFIAQLQDRLGKEKVYREEDRVYFAYVKNPAGLRVEDGYCLCPLIEDGPQTISPTYCICSQGYVKELFDRFSPNPVSVELLESVRTGGKSCRFLIHL